MSKVLRTVKNVVKNFTIPEVKVREATSNDPWFASTVELDELAQYTYQPKSQHEIFQILYKRLHDSSKYWRHILKSLIVLEYLAFHGHEDIYKLLTTTSSIMHPLTTFMFVDTDGKDKGSFIRERAKRMVQYIDNESYFKMEQDKARKTRLKVNKSNTERSNSAFNKGLRSYSVATTSLKQPEYAPRNREEEDLQLQLALAISKQEADDMKTQRDHFESNANNDQFDVFNQPTSTITKKPINYSTGNIAFASTQNQTFDVFGDYHSNNKSMITPVQTPIPENPIESEIYGLFDNTQPNVNFNSNQQPSNFDPFQVPMSLNFNNPVQQTNPDNTDSFNDFIKSPSPFDPVILNTQTNSLDTTNYDTSSTVKSEAINFVNNSGLVDLSLDGFRNKQIEKQVSKKQSLNELMGISNNQTIDNTFYYKPPNLSQLPSSFQQPNLSQLPSSFQQPNINTTVSKNESFSFAPVNQFSHMKSDYRSNMFASQDSFISPPVFQNAPNINQDVNNTPFPLQNQSTYQKNHQPLKRQKNPFEDDSND